MDAQVSVIFVYIKQKKTVDFVMDFGLMEWFYTNFADCFNTNQPSEQGNDQLAYRGKNGETFIDVLELHRQHLTYYPRVLTGFPQGAGEVFQQILEMQFVSKKHSSDDENVQLVIPAISRHPANQRVVDRFLRGIETSDTFVSKEREEGRTKAGHRAEVVYEIDTTRGVRKFRVLDLDIVTVGDAKKFADESTGSRFYVAERPGIAVLPMGFYSYSATRFYYPDMIRNQITPENISSPFRFSRRSGDAIMLFYDRETREVYKTLIDHKAMK